MGPFVRNGETKCYQTSTTKKQWLSAFETVPNRAEMSFPESEDEFLFIKEEGIIGKELRWTSLRFNSFTKKLMDPYRKIDLPFYTLVRKKENFHAHTCFAFNEDGVTDYDCGADLPSFIHTTASKS